MMLAMEFVLTFVGIVVGVFGAISAKSKGQSQTLGVIYALAGFVLFIFILAELRVFGLQPLF